MLAAFDEARDDVSLLGINSVTQPHDKRVAAWNRLADELDLDLLPAMSREVGLSEALSVANDLLDGRIRGRIVVDVNR